MSVYKVVDSYRVADSTTIRGVAYTQVPATNNDAGVPWRTVIAEYRAAREYRRAGAGFPPPAGVSEADLDNGVIHEWDWSLNVSASSTPAQVVAAIEAHIASQETQLTQRIAERFRYSGFTGSTD